MKRLPKKITNEIREILEGCRDGKLQHNQANYHCGTAHCIAGWKAVLDYSKIDRSILEANDDSQLINEDLEDYIAKQPGDNGLGEWGYAQRKWRLTAQESMRLFDANTTLPEQFILLAKLEKGERLEGEVE